MSDLPRHAPQTAHLEVRSDRSMYAYWHPARLARDHRQWEASPPPAWRVAQLLVLLFGDHELQRDRVAGGQIDPQLLGLLALLPTPRVFLAATSPSTPTWALRWLSWRARLSGDTSLGRALLENPALPTALVRTGARRWLRTEWGDSAPARGQHPNPQNDLIRAQHPQAPPEMVAQELGRYLSAETPRYGLAEALLINPQLTREQFLQVCDRVERTLRTEGSIPRSSHGDYNTFEQQVGQVLAAASTNTHCDENDHRRLQDLARDLATVSGRPGVWRTVLQQRLELKRTVIPDDLPWLREVRSAYQEAVNSHDRDKGLTTTQWLYALDQLVRAPASPEQEADRDASLAQLWPLMPEDVFEHYDIRSFHQELFQRAMARPAVRRAALLSPHRHIREAGIRSIAATPQSETEAGRERPTASLTGTQIQTTDEQVSVVERSSASRLTPPGGPPSPQPSRRPSP